MNRSERHNPLNNSDIHYMENKLGELLSPRQANPEFVQKLRTRLMVEPSITLERRRTYKAIWILAVALFSGGLLAFILLLIFGKDEEASG
ncbi:MAG: hypothetical protein GYA15_01795 [Leptolinea sp.]|jgi:hypothetical protein|nr:hypothetical protein [Leptolinea sp.]